MKKYALLFLLVCLAALSACSSERTIYGEIVQVNAGADGMDSFVMRTWEGEEIGVRMTDETEVWSWVDGMSEQDFREDGQIGTQVSIERKYAKDKLYNADGEKLVTYRAGSVYIRGVLERGAAVLSDGTLLDAVREGYTDTYRLADGTELLTVSAPSGPEYSYVSGVEGFDGLTETAQEKVLAYYEAQGLLYDLQEELERAYADYRSAGEDDPFWAGYVSQDTSPTASNERIMCFLTALEGRRDGQLRVGAVFDRETGAHIDGWALFSCSEQEAKRTILDLAGVTGTLRAEMEAAFEPEYIVLFPDTLEVSFPSGTLPSEEYDYMLGLDYDEGVREILHDWAIPDRVE